MGSLENNKEDNRTSQKNTLTQDFCNDDTQKVDSQFSQGDEDDDCLGGTNGIPSHDPFLEEDAFETQLVNVYEETQVVDYDAETQVIDDLEGLKSWPADCNPEVVTSESEGTSTTELLCDDTQVVSEHDTANSCDQRQAANVSGASSDTYKKEEHHSGSVCKGIAFLRTEAFRAAGLAARAGGTNRDLCKSAKSLPDQGKPVQAGFLDRNVSDQNLMRNVCTEGVENQRHAKPIRTSTAVRKLFMEEEAAEVVRSEANLNLTDDCNNPEFLSSESCLAGLSYANSEPPGELSQALALEVVEKFLEQNIMEYDKSTETRIYTAEKAKLDSGAKGSRDLANFKLRHLVGAPGVYDWDDNLEDEGGGDFFLKRKEDFRNNGATKKGSVTEPRKRKRSDLKNTNSAGDHGDDQQKTCNKRSVGDLVCSDPGLMLHKQRAKSQSVHCGEKVIHKNLAKDLDEQINLASEDRLADIEKDIPVVDNIGPDTQMAAEAMENLCFEVHLADESNTRPEKGVVSTTRRTTKKHQSSNKDSSREKKLAQKRQRATSGGVITRRAKHAMSGTIGAFNKSSPISMEKFTRATKEHGRELGGTDQRRMTVSNSEEKLCSSTQPIKKKLRSGLRSSTQDIDPQHGTELAGQRSGMEKKSFLQDQLDFTVPVAHRTRKRANLKQFKVSETSLDATNALDVSCKRRAAKDKNIKMITIEELKRLKSTRCKLSNSKDGASSASYMDDLKHIKGKGTHVENLQGQKDGRHANPSLRRSKTNDSSTSLDAGRNLADHSSKPNASGLLSADKKTKLQNDLENQRSGNDLVPHDFNSLKMNTILEDANEPRATKQVGKKPNGKTPRSSGFKEKNSSLELSPRERAGTTSTCTTPASCATPINRASPVCMGDEYNKQSKVRLSLVREINNLVTGSPGTPGEMKESRKRREITAIRVLFSQHLDVDVVKQQKKILGRLGATIATSMSDATHFVADEFVRTRNMLEAIASGKPVVTHLWLESCGQASCAIDEKSYILRDVRKEKEIGFSMANSLSRACQHPLLLDRKVLVTPTTKPGKDILASLVTAVRGVAVERLGRSVLKSENFPDDILILSCEEDYDVCVPFLEKGGAIYSSELLLNGIVKQKLEYERHRLFEDHVKRTRSTIRVKKNGYLPMSKCKS